MREFTTNHTVYTFDELSPEAKQRAVENHQANEYEYGLDFLTVDMVDKLVELLKAHRIKYDQVPMVLYDLSHSQGSGAMFTGEFEWRSWEVKINHEGHYYHYNSKRFDDFVSVKSGREVTDNAYETFNNIYVDICNELTEFGYDCIDNATSEEAAREYLNDGDTEFYADGSIA